ncbi:MAG: chorismate synthase [Verrucomicrobiota bacterium]|nr:chorismate synthase [Verrucomicrobiota bacterium]
MASNFFGEIFRITTFGESHGPGVGVIIDGCPAGVEISIEEVESFLVLRRPGRTVYTSPRKEEDRVEILSGILAGRTTGAPIALFIRNSDVVSSPYAAIQGLCRPGHAQFTYWKKYGVFDERGGGRASARETAARVAAGAVAKKLLAMHSIDCLSFISAVGDIDLPLPELSSLVSLRKKIYEDPLFCPDEKISAAMRETIAKVREEQDSIGGIVTGVAHLPVGLGEPVYGKMEARLASAMLSLPASKGFEIGAGFQAARMKGSEHNDAFTADDSGAISTATNHAGGTLGGISTGSPLYFRVAFKPTSSIRKPQQTVTLQGKKALFQLPENARHDPCVAIRAVPIVEAMTALVLADLLLLSQSSKCPLLLGCT